MENEFGRISGNVALLDETELEELIEIESDGTDSSVVVLPTFLSH